MTTDNDAVQVLEDLLRQVNELLKQFDGGLLRSSEARHLDEELLRLKKLLPKDGMAYRVLERRMSTTSNWLRATPSGYMAPNDRNFLVARIDTLKAVAEEFGPEALREVGVSKHQYHVAAGEFGRARRLLFELMKQAKSRLIVIDPYADESLFPYLESLQPSVEVALLGGTRPPPKPAVKKVLEGYQKGGRKFSFRTSPTFHDRYLILDDRDIWSMGTSINHAGKSDFTISKIVDKAERDQILSNFQSEWSKGQSL